VSWIAVPTSGLADATAVLLSASAQLRFMPAANFQGTPGSLTVRLADNSQTLTTSTSAAAGELKALSSIGNLGSSTGSWATSAVTVTATVTGVNDAPTTSGSGAQTLTAVAEDVATASNTGGTVSDLFGGRFSDATDNQSGVTGGASTVGSFGGIAIVGNAATATQGTWEYSTDSGSTWTAVSTSVSDSAAVLLPTTATLRFNPALNFNGTPGSLSTRLSDASVNVSASSNLSGLVGGTQHWSAGTVALGTSVTAVNDAPVNTVPGAQSVAEDTDLSITGLSVADVDAASGTVTVTLSVNHGTVTVLSNIAGGLTSGGIATNGTASVVLSGTLTAINATLAGSNAVVYRGTANYNGSDTLTMLTSDGGNTGSDPGLTGTSSTEIDSDTVAITVTAVNDAPVNTVPAAQTVAEDTNLSITGLSVADVDAASGTVTVTLSVTQGTVTVRSDISNGLSAGGIANSGTSSVVLTGTLTAINTTLAGSNAVVYRGTANYNGSDTLTMLTSDGGNTGGGALTDTDTVAITVTAVNDAPVSTSDAVTVLEDTPTVLALTDFGTYSDIEGTAIAGVQITTLQSLGTLEYSANGTTWTAVTLNQTISATDITAGKLRYTGAANANGANYATIGYKVYDGTDYSASAYTLTVSVTAVNDAPTIASGQTYTLTAEPEDSVAPVGAVGTVLDSTLVSGISDVDAGAVKGIAITAADTAHGTWYYSINGGTNWSVLADGSTTPSETSARLLALGSTTRVYFLPTANWNGATGGLSWRAWDQSDIATHANGTTTDVSATGTSTPISANSGTLSLSVSAVNDAPVASGSTTLTTDLEDTASPTAIRPTR
jgi:hypothetical protein